MAIILYNNGITEYYKPENLVFTEDELVDIFDDFEEIKTRRLVKILNTWCIYGYNHINDGADFNKLASDIVEDKIYSPVVFVHDSELNPDWGVTDSILYHGYREFLELLKSALEESAELTISELVDSPEYEEKVDKLPQLSTLGATADKRILFSYNPDEQSHTFYANEEFYKFAQKVYDYISVNTQQKEPFTIYADKKAVIIIDTPKVNTFLNSILEKFKSVEEYEICTQLTKIISEWDGIIKEKQHKIKKSDEENK